MLLAHPRRFAVLTLLLLLAPPPLCAEDNLKTRIDEIIDRPEYKAGRWGLLLVDADSGKPIYERRADELFAPASVTKLFTCAAALATFGADYRFRTPVYQRGQVKDGVLKGDLILVAKGDPTLGGRTDANGHLVFKNSDHTYATFTSTLPELVETDPLAGLRCLARQIHTSGIREVEGDVLIDDRLFAPAFGSGSGPKIVTPIMVNDNLLDVVVSPGKSVGERAAVRLRPDNRFLQVDADVKTVAGDKKAKITVELVGLGRYVLRGRIPLGSRPVVRICLVMNPELFARGLFIEALCREGVRVQASPLNRSSATLPNKDAYAGMTTVARYESPPLSELIKVILKVSHNLYASTLPLLIASKHGKSTLAEGMALEGKIFGDLGVDVKSLALESGAGGGDADHLTPRVTVQLLRVMAARDDFPVFRAALPILGVDGTLAGVVEKDSPARGKVRAKTGTYYDNDLMNERTFLRSKSLAGLMTTKNGRRLVFAVFVNDVPLRPGLTTGRVGKTIGRLCEVIYQHTPR